MYLHISSVNFQYLTDQLHQRRIMEMLVIGQMFWNLQAPREVDCVWLSMSQMITNNTHSFVRSTKD